MIRRYEHKAIVSFKNLLERQSDGKNIRRPLRTVKDVLMLLNAILYDANSFEYFYMYGDDIDVWLTTDEKNKIVKISVGKEQR